MMFYLSSPWRTLRHGDFNLWLKEYSSEKLVNYEPLKSK